MPALLLLYFECLITVDILWLFLLVPWVGMQCVIVVFPDHTNLLSLKPGKVQTSLISYRGSFIVAILQMSHGM